MKRWLEHKKISNFSQRAMCLFNEGKVYFDSWEKLKMLDTRPQRAKYVPMDIIMKKLMFQSS
ncbi:hypothetical protein ACA29_15230 [Lederbergia galactosidilytica]|uniref:Uncharacterized protein n=1 Tax=Lederbergia galactosidilytica TaxID=217031 RepID=A0A0Q9XTY3_9BACI|nr:hypothetical protein ACA29_15230 [Lederbergia galactosidilytica]